MLFSLIVIIYAVNINMHFSDVSFGGMNKKKRGKARALGEHTHACMFAEKQVSSAQSLLPIWRHRLCRCVILIRGRVDTNPLLDTAYNMSRHPPVPIRSSSHHLSLLSVGHQKKKKKSAEASNELGQRGRESCEREPNFPPSERRRKENETPLEESLPHAAREESNGERDSGNNE